MGMGILILIGICCIFMIIAIVCSFIFGKFYETRKNQQCKQNRDEYDGLNV